ncbi:MAG: Asp-tRNA(Asn)/Glu-tRNA(Gln) amidotransferase subunit GatB [Planctomycetota bacterium JB042]
MSGAFESVVGLEVHVQLATRTKLFCGCLNVYGADANTNVCSVCTGQPGALPVLNALALELAVRAGLALGCAIAPRTKFDRKNYFYPDLPKGYQISQLERPVNGEGSLRFVGEDGGERVVRIARAHLEEDAGKTMHPDGDRSSLVDLNRAGIPLLEIVSFPDLRTPQEAHLYLTELKRRLRYARVSECDMEKGSLRCDANVSIRPVGATGLGTRTEIKNLNSFRNVERALAYEVERQIAVVEEGGEVVQETRTWREDEERTETLRSKEEAEDYRYFPDPDLPEFALDEEWVEAIRAALPEMPDVKRARYVESLGLPEATADVLCADRDAAEWFDACVAALPEGGDAKGVANAVTGVVLALANDQGVSIAGLRLTPERLVEAVRLVDDGTISRQAARKVIAELDATDAAPAEVVERLGLAQVSDEEALGTTVDEVIAAQEKVVEDYRGGNENALNALVGGVMKATKGKANPQLARELLIRRLGGAGG